MVAELPRMEKLKKFHCKNVFSLDRRQIMNSKDW